MEAEEENSSAFFISDSFPTLLSNCMIRGMSEKDFWDMTLAEIERFADSYDKRKEIEIKEIAQRDYLHARLIAIAMSGKTFPSLHEAYPTVFEDEQRKLFEQRLIEFANYHNEKIGKKDGE